MDDRLQSSLWTSKRQKDKEYRPNRCNARRKWWARCSTLTLFAIMVASTREWRRNLRKFFWVMMELVVGDTFFHYIGQSPNAQVVITWARQMARSDDLFEHPFRANSHVVYFYTLAQKIQRENLKMFAEVGMTANSSLYWEQVVIVLEWTPSDIIPLLPDIAALSNTCTMSLRCSTATSNHTTSWWPRKTAWSVSLISV